MTHSPAAAPGKTGWAIRPARIEDVPAVAAAVADLLVELGGTPPAAEALETEARAHVEDPSLGLVLVAATSGDAKPSRLTPTVVADSAGARDTVPDGEFGELVGVLTASWARAVQVAGRLLTIEVLWTRREWRDLGLGAALVDALAAAAAAEGVARVEVGLPREGFAALRATERFYLANGFERLGPRMRRTVA